MPLKVNFTPKRVYQGQIPGHEAFVLLPDEAREMARRDPSSRKILFPFLIGRDLIAQSQSKPSRYVIDMNAYDVLEAQQFREAFRRIREQVLPLREQKAKAEIERNRQSIGADSEAKVNRHHQMFLSQWWKHSYGRPDMIAEIHKRSRYIVCSEVTKRSIFEFVSPLIRPDHALQAFMFADDYSFGVLQSRIHWEWLTEKGSTLTDRFRYTPHSVFDTFPWPQSPTPNQVKAVAQAAQELHEYRRQIMAKRQDLTLRVMYRSLELPGKNRLKELHMALDEAVMAAYGFDPGGDLLAQLLELNHTVAAHIEAGELVTGPGIPPNYPDPTELVSTGCITPSELI